MEQTTATAVAQAASATPAPAPAAPSNVPTFAFSIGELSRGGAQLTSLCADLASINACAYCMLRFINVKQEKAYQQTKEVRGKSDRSRRRFEGHSEPS
jgi:hypothetical protein